MGWRSDCTVLPHGGAALAGNGDAIGICVAGAAVCTQLEGKKHPKRKKLIQIFI